MTTDTAATVSQQLLAAGFEHSRRIASTGESIFIQKDRLEGPELLALMGILVPGGTPLPDVAIAWEQPSGIVIT
jgi:hypothetical protein